MLWFQIKLFYNIYKSKFTTLTALKYSLFFMFLIYMITAGGALPSLTTWVIFGIIASTNSNSRFDLQPLNAVVFKI